VTAAGKLLWLRWDRVLVGARGSGRVPFHGRVRNFRIELVAVAPRPHAGLLLNAIRAVLFALAVFGAWHIALPAAGVAPGGGLRRTGTEGEGMAPWRKLGLVYRPEGRLGWDRE
jgi:hypothetical protein